MGIGIRLINFNVSCLHKMLELRLNFHVVHETLGQVLLHLLESLLDFRSPTVDP